VHNARLMSTPKPGQIQCPTCHRSTPPTAFCTQCGAPIPPGARARPRGLGRDELDERRRARRPGDMPFRRGVPVGEPGDYQPFRPEPFRPEPEDELVRQPGATGGEAEPRIDNTPPGFDERPVEPPPPATPTFAAPPTPVPAAASPPPTPSRPSPPPAQPPRAEAPRPAPAPAPVPPVVPEPEEEPVWPAVNEDYPAADAFVDQYRASAYREEPESGSGLVGPLAIVAFVALGVMAIGVGVVISGILGGAAQSTPSPTPLVSQAPASTAPSTAPASTAPSTAQTPAATPTPEQPVVFPDGFTARVEPCAEQPISIDGCDSDGSTITGDTVWVWIGFHQGGDGDTLSVNILDSTATSVRDGDIDLGGICSSCNGYVRFRFSGLSPGSYTIKVERNGEFADEATFAVAG